MTKRWERELRRLDGVQPPTDRIRTRAALGPQGSGPGGMLHRRQRITAGVVAAAVFVAAGVFAWNVLRPQGTARSIGSLDLEHSLVVTLRAPAGPSTDAEPILPTAEFRLADQHVEIPTQGITGWPDIPDDIGFNQPLYGLGFDVPVGTPLVIEGDASSASATVRSGDSIDSPSVNLDLSDGSDRLPTDPGEHVMDLTGEWPEGTATFTASFHIVRADADGQVTLSFVGKNAPEGTLAFVDDTQRGLRGEYTWCDGTDGCVNGIPDFVSYPPPPNAFTPVPGSTPLAIEGDATAIKGTYRTVDGDQVSPTFEWPGEEPTPTPTAEGKYILELHVALRGPDGHGSATFWFGVRATPPGGTGDQSVSSEPSPSPAGLSNVLRIRCDGEQIEVLTPVVAAQPDGVHVDVTLPDQVSIVARPVQLPQVEWAISSDLAANPIELPDGEISLACDMSPIVSAEFQPHATVTIVASSKAFTPYVPECPTTNLQTLRTGRGDPRQGWSSSDEAVSRAIDLLPGDRVERAGYAQGEWPWLWSRIIRDGRVVAAVMVDGRPGWRYRVSWAMACEGSALGEPESNQDGVMGFG